MTIAARRRLTRLRNHAAEVALVSLGLICAAVAAVLALKVI